MLRFILHRLLVMVPTLAVVSMLIFTVINLPPGDYLSNQIAELRATGQEAGLAKAEFLRREYALDRPLPEQYLVWVGLWPGPNGFNGLLQGDLGWSFEFNRPVAEVVGETLWFTVILNLAAVLFVYLVSFPLGSLAAIRANSWVDYLAATIGYIGLATPNFLLALILLYYGQKWLGLPIGGLMDAQYEDQPMSWAKIGSVLEHLIVPTIVIGLSGTAAMVRRLRANLLDELGKPYVVTAKAKGVPPLRRLARYPLRMALNPFVSDIGSLLPSLVSGSVLISVVLSLPTIGPALLEALRAQDIFLSGFILMFISLLVLVGMLISDIALALLDPRIRLGKGRKARS
ncbi:ABC transporter permease [Azospirillum thiophilum]|uniref:ABC transporter permease n=1 Tax=Azospirillum thiophilum TaxID=528244 RepID=A0AAC8W2K4_9PROT|nr:ABC transporter permease [Azospirillum thiophilum]ALG73933.1 ABC transporter permease [Azospirillum thiophilum]KJR63723.1 ABC transporter permease [Azospirillum thiophilum]